MAEEKDKQDRKRPQRIRCPKIVKKTKLTHDKMLAALEKIKEGALKVRVVKDIDMLAGLFTAATTLIILAISFGILVIKTGSLKFSLGVSLILVWLLIIIFWDRIRVKVRARKAKVYLNEILTREMVVYLKGFHFLWSFYSKENDDVDFQKQVEILARETDNSAPVFMSSDGWEVRVQWASLLRRRSDETSLSHSLNYPDHVVEYWIRVLMDSCISDLGGANSLDSMRSYKEDIASWLRRVLAGEEYGMLNISNVLGYDIELQVESVNLANEEDRKSKAGVGRARIMREQAMENKKEFPSMTEGDAFDNANIAEELVNKSIIEFRGVPAGAIVALGGDISSLVNKQQKGGKK
jgi:hypothetical protein